jgi:hypothetical protein
VIGYYPRYDADHNGMISKDDVKLAVGREVIFLQAALLSMDYLS